MLGNPLNIREPQAQDIDNSRPTKRARNGPVGDVVHRDSALVGFVEDNLSTSSEIGKNNRHDTATQRPQDKEKNRRLSCKECRRLKLKCDRVFPCQSCCKRGCAEICPEGALTSGRGSRFILANTEQLHEKIVQLSDRVRHLEDGLESLQSTCSSDPHPLLSPDLLRIKTSQELYSPTHPGHLLPPDSSAGSRGDDGLITLNPPWNESSREGIKPKVPGLPAYYGHQFLPPMVRESSPPEVPPDILQLSATFPFPWQMDLKIRARIRDALPPRPEAQFICEEAHRNALWQFNLDASETFLPNLLHHVYTTSIQDLSPRRLALLLMILSIGSLVDLNRPLGSVHGEAYHHLARASVCEIPLMEEPDFDVLHALFFMIWYHLIFSDNKKAVGYAWNMMGFVAKLAQGLGLHRDGSRLKVIPEENEKRRAVFWELLNLDCRMSLSLGRPPSFSLRHVDTKPPSYLAEGMYVPREEVIYHEWKNSFFIQCLTPILEAMIVVKPPEYAHIIALDHAVRDFNIPPLLDGHNSDGLNTRFLVMQRALVTTSRDIALLQLHRRYFTEAMSGPEPFDLHHEFAPSVLATYLAASSLISAVETLYDQEPQLSARFLCFWFNAFSGAVALSLFLSRAPSTPLAPFVLQELERVCQLFRRVAKILPFSGKSLFVLERLADKSRRVYSQWHRASQSRISEHSMSSGHPQLLPPSFMNVHSSLSRYLEQIIATHPMQIPDFTLLTSNIRQPPRQYIQPSGTARSDEWLPDIYRFNTVGVGVEERYTVALAQPTPFMPSEPRVAENETFNFDYGALTSGLTETSYMAWF